MEQTVSNFEDRTKKKKKFLRLTGIGIIILGLILYLWQMKNIYLTNHESKPNTSFVPTAIPLPKKPIPSWETFTSSLGYNIQYQSPLMFTSAIENKNDVLTYYLLQNKEKVKAFQLTVLVASSDLKNLNEMPRATSWEKVQRQKLGIYDTLYTTQKNSSGSVIESYYVLNKGKLYNLSIASFLPSPTAILTSLKEKVLASFRIIE